MSKPKTKKPTMYALDQRHAAPLRAQACEVLGHADFSELAVCVMLRQLIRKGRIGDARALLGDYARKFPLAGPVLRLKAQLDAVP